MYSKRANADDLSRPISAKVIQDKLEYCNVESDCPYCSSIRTTT